VAIRQSVLDLVGLFDQVLVKVQGIVGVDKIYQRPVGFDLLQGGFLC